MAEKVRDLRSALERLRNMPGQLAETDVEVDPMAELARTPALRLVFWQAGNAWLPCWTASRRVLEKCCITA